MTSTSIQISDDSLLVTRTLSGDPRSFEELFRRYSDRVFSIAMGMVRNEPEAHDVVQETFLNAYRKLHTYRAESPFRGWLFRIASNASLMRLRSRRRRPEQPLRIQGPSYSEDGGFERPVVDLRPLAPKSMEDRELGERLHQAIDALPDKYRAVLILADFEHLSMREIGERLDLSVPAVKTRLHRARLSIREALQDYLAGQL
ncbi:MAG: sigma-70 family RNA polymerase sigma factor [Myxococcota bacterium]|nr:sigma-70 family RNA polymerase sigma factor [Myxococcota bacterium]